MFGRRPYTGKSRKEIREQMVAEQVHIKKSDVPEGWSMEAADFVNKLLQRKPANRLGLNGPSEVKNHMWFKGIDWQQIIEKKAEAPFKPRKPPSLITSVEALTVDPKKMEDKEKPTPQQIEDSLMLLRRNSIQNLFNGYEYDIEQLHHQALQEKKKKK
jgi:hypothetical protein